MTANQVAYNNLLEVARHNRTSEEISRASTRAALHQAETSRLSQQEVARHNAVEEDIKRGTLAISSTQAQEVARHNRTAESIQQSEIAVRQRTADESVRHNKASELIARAQLEESKRHAMAAESISSRQASLQYQVGMANASAAATSARAAMLSANVAQQNVSVNMLKQMTEARRVDETIRHNEEMEKISSANAQADLIRSGAARTQADVASGLATSQKVANYANAAASAIQGTSKVLGVIGKLIG